MADKIKITVVGSGYVGMSLAALLSQHNDVVILDIDPERVETINNNKSTIADTEIDTFLLKNKLSIEATLDKSFAYSRSKFIVVATPTDYDQESNHFDTSSVDSVIEDALSLNSDATIIIKSTIPVGHTKLLRDRHNTDRIVFSPEFLREGRALRDNLYPSRIIIGSECESSIGFADLLINGSKKEDVEILLMESEEAEAVKLFANTYLAMRISFFNELDSYALAYDLDAKKIIDGVCLDERIGLNYNNPSFGYGGYCLPKDTKQLLANYDNIPQALIEAIVSSNSTRKDFISSKIIELNPKIVGIYRLVMKKGSDNFRTSAIQSIIKRLRLADIDIVIYEPNYDGFEFMNSQIIASLSEFKSLSDVIISNRLSDDLNDVIDKVFTRDIYGRD